MTESTPRSRVVRALDRGGLHGVAIENGAGTGTPDVNFAGGWIEMKYLKEWPKRAGTSVRPQEPLKPEQRHWLEDRDRAGERCYVMLQVKRTQEWVLLDGLVAVRILGEAPRAELVSQAVAHWRGRQMEKEIVACLSARRR